MDSAIKVVSGEIVYSDETLRSFSSLEQMLLIVSREHDRHGMADRVRVQGVDERGKLYRLGLEFISFQLQDGAETDVSMKTIRKQKLLGELLVESGIITAEQLKNAIGEQGNAGITEKIGEVLVRLGCCSPAQVLSGLAKQIGIDLKSL